MVSVTALWLPIVLSAFLVFVASSIIHMLLTYHRSDYAKLPDEDQILGALRTHNIPPGDYFFPHATSPSDLNNPGVLEKFTKGPVGLVTVRPSGPPTMGKSLVMWFAYCVVIGVFVAYVTGLAVGPGAEYMMVFRIASSVGFLGYGAAIAHDSIWKSQAWSTTIKHMFDGVVYALLTAGVFGWLWPN